MPVTLANAMMGVPSAPNATGAVLAISDKPEACSGLKPRPIRSAAVTRPAFRIRRRLKERAETESDQQQLQAAILSDSGHAVLQNLEASRLDGELIHKDDIQDDPADGKQAVSAPLDGRSRSQSAGMWKTNMAVVKAVASPSNAA